MTNHAPVRAGPLARLKQFAPLILILAVLIAAVVSGATGYLSLDSLRTHAATLQAYAAVHPVLSIGLFILVYVVCTAASVPGASLLTLAGGFIFGPWIGGAATVVGATLGSGGALARISEGVRQNAFSAILSLRLIPAVPFWLLNVGAGIADAPLGAYALATFLGIMPATFIYSGIGHGLGRVFEAGGTPDLSVLYQPHVLVPLVGLGLLSLAPILVRRLRRKAV